MRVLNLGAGVQSTTIYLMMIDGEIPAADVAIFADTGDEPVAVYEHLEYLKTLGGPEIRQVSAGNLGDSLINGVNASKRPTAIPAHLAHPDGSHGLGSRQCTGDFKFKPIEQEIRRLCGVQRRQRMPKGLEVTEVFGLSYDEPKRVARVKDRFVGRKGRYCEFPLFDEFMTRQECIAWLKKRLPDRVVPRSACVFCPFKTDDEWLRLKKEDPRGWERAVQIDRAIRDPKSSCNRDMRASQFLHRSREPLELVQLQPLSPDRQAKFSWSQMDCEGMCGV